VRGTSGFSNKEDDEVFVPFNVEVVSAIKVTRNYASSVSMSKNSFESGCIFEKEIKDIHKQKLKE
jgi:hypothetical protein